MTTTTNPNEYNGWTNYQTWLINLHYGDYLQETLQENPSEFLSLSRYDRVKLVREQVESLVYDVDGVNAEGFIGALVNDFLCTVNWYELSDNYAADLPEVEDDEDDEDDEDEVQS